MEKAISGLRNEICVYGEEEAELKLEIEADSHAVKRDNNIIKAENSGVKTDNVAEMNRETKQEKQEKQENDAEMQNGVIGGKFKIEVIELEDDED